MPNLSQWLAASLCILALSAPISRAQSDTGNLFPDIKDAQKTDTPTNNQQIPPPVPPVPTPASSSTPQIAPTPQKKIPIPSSTAQKAALDLVSEAYKDDITKATTPQLQTELAKKLLQAGIETNDSAGRFVLFTKAKNSAAQAGDIETAFAAIDEMDQTYQIDALRTKAEIITAAAKGIRSADDLAGLIEQSNKVIDAAIAADRYDLAKQVADLSLSIARRTDDPTLAKQTAMRVNEVQTCAAAFTKLKAPLATLAQNPSDPDANLAVGKFYCFFKGDWDRGSPMLTLGSDATLKALALQEIAGATDADSEVALGDGWWKVAEGDTNPTKGQIQERAGKWYSEAVDKLTGLDKAKVETRLKKLAAAQQLTIGKRKFKNSIGMQFIEIRSGTFIMGTPVNETGRDENETPHQVTLTKSFMMQITPVTQAQWQAMMGNNPSHFKGDTLPVDMVNWDDAVAFCQKLTQKEGKHYRLPTEAEWEYACRSGTQTAYNIGNDENALKVAGWYKGNCGQTTHAVGTKQVNAWGLYDMHGNVWQWCNDWYGEYPKEAVIDPKGAANGQRRIIRGGSWYDNPPNCRSGNRHWDLPIIRYNCFGFRLVLDLN